MNVGRGELNRESCKNLMKLVRGSENFYAFQFIPGGGFLPAAHCIIQFDTQLHRNVTVIIHTFYTAIHPFSQSFYRE